MEPNFDTMMIAVRVLTAVIEKRTPEPNDLDRLRRFLPRRADLPSDELAGEVIRQAIKRRSERQETPERRANAA
jgi:hypothetical protein